MKQYKSFKEFYPFYLSQHQNIVCKRLHFVGMLSAILFVLAFIFSFNIGYLIFALIAGYGLAWMGHAMFEKNKPATFQHPLYSLLGDLMLFKDVITGKVKLF